jgi:hypothetical protein
LRFVKERVEAAAVPLPSPRGAPLARQRSIRDVLGQRDRYLLRFDGGKDSCVTVRDDDKAPPWTAEFWVRRSGPSGVLRVPRPTPSDGAAAASSEASTTSPSSGGATATLASWPPSKSSKSPPAPSSKLATVPSSRTSVKDSHRVLAWSDASALLLECGRSARNRRWVGIYIANPKSGAPFVCGCVCCGMCCVCCVCE